MIDRSKITIKNVLWYLIFGIGYLTLYSNYFFPEEWGKKRNVSTSGRRMKSKHLWGPIYAITIYFILAMFLLVGSD